MLILDLWGISFHAVIVFGLGKNHLFKSVLGHCAYLFFLLRLNFFFLLKVDAGTDVLAFEDVEEVLVLCGVKVALAVSSFKKREYY